MNFKKLKEEIELSPNKKDHLIFSGILKADSFAIISALYSRDIPCSAVTSVDDIYNVGNQYQLDPQLFSNPFYIKVSLENFDESTIDIINQLDSEAFIQVVAKRDIDDEKLQLLSKINREKCQFSFNGFISQDTIDTLFSKFDVDNECHTTLIIDRIDSTTINKINDFCSKVDEPYLIVVIKDLSSLQDLYSILPYISKDEISVSLDDEIFNDRNSNNARSFVVKAHDEQLPEGKKLNVAFRKMNYDSLEQVYELERHLELIKSHIPSNARELDIVTYVTLFVINYFKYDVDMYDKYLKKEHYEQINFAQFVTNGKGVCSHFAGFTEYLLNSLGVECKDIGSAVYNPEVVGHAFNAVKIDGRMHFLDNTWLAGRIQSGEIQSLAESTDFLASNARFGHEEYEDDLAKYQCEDYDRQEISNSVNRVMNWRSNYSIHAAAVKDLFRRHILKKEKSVDEKIEDAIPRRR